MDRKSVLYFGCSLAALALTVGACLTSNANYNSFAVIKAEADNITVSDGSVFLEGNIGDGSFYMRTANGNRIKFESEGVTVSSDGDLVFSAGGYILNPYFEADGTDGIYGDNAISGMTGILITHDGAQGDIAVDYTWGESLTGSAPYYQRRGYVFPKTQSYGFLSENPNYICIRAVKAVTVSEISLNYSCSRGEEKGDNLKIDSPTMLERFKTTVNWGNSYEGQTVELSEDIDMDGVTMAAIGNNSNPFKGTFDGKGHIISNLTVTGASQVSLFGNVVDGTVKNLVIDNIYATATASSGSGRAAGAIGRAERATMENIKVTSGTIIGHSQNGGIVGVIVNGGNIKNCECSASITGSAGGGNGGIVGYNATSGELEIVGCTFKGTVSSSASGQTTGGILGNTVTSTGTSILIGACEVDSAASISCAGTEATSARAANGYIVGNADNTYITVSGSGKITNTISTVSEWDDFVTAVFAAGEKNRYKVAKLVADLDMEGGGNYLATFAGLLDGNGHKISNMSKSGTDQIALMGNCLRGGARNLQLENASFTATTQRAAGIAGRSENACFYNVEILSGTITGKKQSGGIAGAVVTSKTWIVDCVNRANVTGGTDLGLGGLVGTITSTGASVGIYGSSNYGSISSGSGSIGGLIGYAASFTASNVLSLKDCINYGSVKTTGKNQLGVGGILGEIGAINQSTSVSIVGCDNRGEITGTGNYTAGIFGGWDGKVSAQGATVLFDFKGCVNYGTVNGASVAGVAGIYGYLVSVATVKNVAVTENITGCQNNGEINNGTAEYTSGFFGGWNGGTPATGTSVTFVIDDCINNGNITGGGNGCGGFVGATTQNVANYLVIKVLNSSNYGYIKGNGYVGGITGLIRNTNSGNESIIDNCYNFGTVESRTAKSIGGISGTARISVTNCGCYSEASLKTSATTYLAKNRSESGGGSDAGYIALNYENGCGAHTGNRLVNLDGSDYAA